LDPGENREVNPAERSAASEATRAVATSFLLIAGIEYLVRAGLVDIPNPAALSLLAVVYAGYSGGLYGGLSSAALTIAYGIYRYLLLPDSLPGLEAITRVAVIALVALSTAGLIGRLRARAEQALRQKVETQARDLAKLQQAELRLKNRETQLRALLDALPAYVAYVDRDLIVRFHNRSYEEWTGLPGSFIDGHSIEEVIGKHLFETGTREHALDALAGKASVFERVHTDRQGRRSVVEAHFLPDVAEDGSIAGYYGMLFDVTRHKESQARVARLTERLRRALSSSRLALWEFDLRSGVVELGREWAQIVGGDEVMSEVKAADLRKLVHPDDRARVDEALQSVLEKRADQYDIEHRVLSVHGEWKWVRSTGRIVEHDAGGRPTRLSGTNRDITPRKLAELALGENERRLRLLTDAVPAMIVYVDADQRYRFCNRRYSETMGRSEADIIGRTVRDVVGQGQYEVSRPWLEKALAGEQCEHERRHEWPEGTVSDLSVMYVPHKADDGTVLGLYALLVDLTERKRAERIKERFLSMVSHELRTPLTSVIWTLESLAELSSDRLSGEEVAMLGVAQQNAERMLHLADEILDLEQLDQSAMRMSPRSVSLPELVRRVIELNEGLAQKHGVRVVAKGAAAATAVADPDRIVQVLSNLISNAAKHSPRGSEVEIGIEPRGTKIRVSVADRGPGVPEEFVDHLFGRFAQSAQGRKVGGSGLGLAISKEIVERSGGTIGYRPNPGGGSMFWFDLPSEPAPDATL
jgi:PAS domain S-box-containing protein